MFIGISAYFHESSVALINDNGNLIDYQREDWHSRIKGDKSFPRLALNHLINQHNIDTKEVIFIFYEKPLRSWITLTKYSIRSNGLFSQLSVNNFKNFWKSSISFYFELNSIINGNYKDILYSDHHLSHALTNFQYSFNFEFPIVSIVIDGYGDKDCTSAYLFEGTNKVTEVWRSSYPNSIGLFYSAITDFLGFSINDGEFKVMGLSSYGKPKYLNEMRKMIYFHEEDLILNMKYFDFDKSVLNSYSSHFEKKLNVSANKSPKALEVHPDFQIYADIACSAQTVITEITMQLFEKLHHQTKIKNFHLSGGVALNCKMISVLSNLNFIENLFVSPSPGDAGASIGAAYFGFLNSYKENHELNKLDNLYPGIFSQDPSFMDQLFEKYCDKENLVDCLKNLLLDNHIIATCFSNMETGPRALGNRSLICNAENKSLVHRLSTEIKGREGYIPVAPVMLLNTAKKYYELKDNIFNCYYSMSANAQLKADIQNYKFGGIVHIDNSSRIQICKENSLIGNVLIKSDGKLEILANTSFNFSNDPISYGLEDSILGMKKMNLEYLVTDIGIYKIK